MPKSVRVAGTTRNVLSHWVTLVSRVVERPGRPSETYHSLALPDYVSVLALTSDGQIPLVRQFRPAVERVTLELPGGLLDTNDPPEAVAARELEEETGMHAIQTPVLLGKLVPDTGRLENHFWCFFTHAEPMGGWRPEAHVERLLYTRSELRRAILDGAFDHALHIALLALARLQGQFSWNE